MPWEVNQDVVKFEISMHHILLIQCLASRNDLFKTTDGESLWETSMKVQKVLHAATIGKLKYTVKVALCLDHFDLLDDVWAVDHLEEN